ncbi:MAG: hypothetical protein AAFY44_10355 [Pseudomonadota bacterium]
MTIGGNITGAGQRAEIGRMDPPQTLDGVDFAFTIDLDALEHRGELAERMFALIHQRVVHARSARRNHGSTI